MLRKPGRRARERKPVDEDQDDMAWRVDTGSKPRPFDRVYSVLDRVENGLAKGARAFGRCIVDGLVAYALSVHHIDIEHHDEIWGFSGNRPGKPREPNAADSLEALIAAVHARDFSRSALAAEYCWGASDGATAKSGRRAIEAEADAGRRNFEPG